MRDDFAVFILTHGRPDNVMTIDTLKRRGYTGKLFLVVDDEDKALPQYVKNFGKDKVLVFSKDEVAKTMDQFDNAKDRRTITWARNACYDLAEKIGVQYFIQLDDDYYAFSYRWIGKKNGELEPSFHGWAINSMDDVLSALVSFVENVPGAIIAMSQGGDHVGGADKKEMSSFRVKRKCMNSFVCDVSHPVSFLGRLNEDVNTYVYWGRRGRLFFTYWALQLDQSDTQSNPGGITELYKSLGTYPKAFYTVMVAPSCVKVGMIGKTDKRLHHSISWNHAVPKIVSEDLRKPRK